VKGPRANGEEKRWTAERGAAAPLSEGGGTNWSGRTQDAKEKCSENKWLSQGKRQSADQKVSLKQNTQLCEGKKKREAKPNEPS